MVEVRESELHAQFPHQKPSFYKFVRETIGFETIV